MISRTLVGEHNLLNQHSIVRALQISLAAVVAAAFAIAIVTLTLNWHLIPELSLAVMASAMAAIVLSRSGHHATAVLLTVGGIVYAVMHAAAVNDGIRSVGLAIIPVLILAASLLMRQRVIATFTGTAILVTAAMLAIRYSVLRVETYSSNDLGDFLIFAVTCASAGWIGRTLSAGIEHSFAEEKDRLSAVIASITDEVWFADANKQLVFVNPAAEREFRLREVDGIDVEQLAARFDVFRPDGSARPKEESPLLRALNGETICGEEVIVRTPATGELRHRQVKAAPVKDTSGNTIGSVCVVRDITESKQAEKALREREQQLASIYNTVQDVLFDLFVEPGGQFRFNSVNSAFLRVTGLGREAVVGKAANEVIPEPSLAMVLEKYRKAIEEKTVVSWEETSNYPAGQLTGEVTITPVFDAQGTCTHLVGSVHDITERKRLELERERLQRELAHAQKMECVGRLAGGVAHDFNNLMSVIVMHCYSAVEELAEGHPALESVEEIRGAAQRAVALGRQLMIFSSKQVLKTEILNLNTVIGESQKLIQRLIGEDVKVVFESGSGSCLVKADRGQLTQVLMNLAVNSRDAMPGGGTLAIEIASVELDEASGQLGPGAEPGAYVRLAVRDTGIWMDQETRARVFEPFFTTKGVGKGTGLGMSVVYAMVKNSGGFIMIASEPGHGTEFRIYLPAVMEIPETIADTAERPTRGGSETILLVEDEPALRNKIHELLEKARYQVLSAPDGEQAYALFLRHERPIHLLLTDVVMPGMSGPRLSERLRTLRAETKVLYMSGYPDADDAGIDLRSLQDLIEKPFTKETLLRRVREVLDRDQAAAAVT